jgi:hypothetical protein
MLGFLARPPVPCSWQKPADRRTAPGLGAFHVLLTAHMRRRPQASEAEDGTGMADLRADCRLLESIRAVLTGRERGYQNIRDEANLHLCTGFER